MISVTGRVLVLFLLLWISPQLSAQENETANSIGLGYGLNLNVRQDRLFSDIVNKSNSLVGSRIYFERTNSNALQNYTFDFAVFTPHTPTGFPAFNPENGDIIENYRTNFQFYDFKYSYLRKSGQNNNLYFGGTFSWQTNIINYESSIFNTFGYFVNFSLAPSIMTTRKFGEQHQLSGKLMTSLINWTSRSPYALEDDQVVSDNTKYSDAAVYFVWIGQGKFVLPDKLQRLDLDVRYSYLIRSRWSVGFNYHLGFMRYTKPKTFTSYNNNFYLFASFNF